ncbi:hypothetical protein M0804_009908 [Polistes exclamans]|nr:hypothetical protein M0804_009908 [Polistes exclamans]
MRDRGTIKRTQLGPDLQLATKKVIAIKTYREKHLRTSVLVQNSRVWGRGMILFCQASADGQQLVQGG